MGSHLIQVNYLNIMVIRNNKFIKGLDLPLFFMLNMSLLANLLKIGKKLIE
jgi:hypothetical protein